MSVLLACSSPPSAWCRLSSWPGTRGRDESCNPNQQGEAEKMLDDYVGKNVFVRTVTHHYTGRLAEADDDFLFLEDAAWIADDGRFTQALADGALSEVEPFPGACLVSRGAILDVSEWLHELPRTQK